ncbi:preprotein translocase subunit YajC [Chthonobacter rhizosphaerae]|uniref:preprotein translocase subunit YajC n=1 Tax=Chthonobacter rhizosphaerae TaxID=2735553 RepID=UPI0015EF2F96|nr:preprotein translocase subunit YajC [Chthonobacter rhizosphaerae]
MFVTPAFAQAAGEPAGATAFLIQFMPFILIFVIMYFLLIRPQQKRAAEHRDMIKNLRRGDVVVMNGGLVGKIAKIVDDSEMVLDIGEGAGGIKVRVARGAVAELRSKGEPVKDA